MLFLILKLALTVEMSIAMKGKKLIGKLVDASVRFPNHLVDVQKVRDGVR